MDLFMDTHSFFLRQSGSFRLRFFRGFAIWILALSLAAVLFPERSQAQENVTMRGLVTSSADGGALVNANVLLQNRDGDRVAATATDTDGFYEIRDVESGVYQIRVSYLGFETYQDTVSLSTGLRQYNVRLTPTPQQLDEVEVEAERGGTEREAGLQTVGTADLERIPTPGPSGDLAAYLQTLPGVVSVGDRGGQLFIRGGTPTQNLIRVDDLPIIKPFHISGLFSTFPEEIVKTVDIHAGGFGAEYMGAISSVLDVSLREGNFETYEGSASVSPFLASARIEGPIRRGTDSFLAIARRSLIEETGNTLYNRDTPLGFHDVTARYSLQIDDASCSATGMYSSDRGQINPERRLELSWSNTVIGGRCLLFGEDLGNAITLSAGYTRFQNSAGPVDSPTRNASVRKLHLSAETEQEVFSNTLNYGARWEVTNYSFDLDEKFTSIQRRSQAGGAVQAFASMDWSLGERWTLSPSFGTHLTSRRLQSPTYEPRLRVSFRPTGTDDSEFNLALGKYNQPAEGLTDERDAGTVFTVWSPSGPNEPILGALHAILGYRHRVGSYLQLSLEGFAKDLSNVPVPEWSTVAQFDVETALANGKAYGFDLRSELETESFYLFLGYGWSKVTYRAARNNLGAWVGGNVFEFTPAHDRRHQLNLVATYALGEFKISTNWKLASGRPYTKVFGFDLSFELPEQDPATDPGTAQTYYAEPYGARLPAFHRLDVSVSRSFDLSSGLSLETEAGAINTYDRRNVFYYDINSIERVDQSPLLPYASLRLAIE